MLFKKITRKLFVRLGIEIQKVGNSIAQATLPKFGNSPRNVVIELPRTIINPDRIFLGNEVRLGQGSLLYPITHYPTRWMQHPTKKQPQQKFDPKITIGNRVTATSKLQLAAFDEITIEDDVLFASNVNITEGLHGYENANVPYKYQKIFKVAHIIIKQGCWIGQNAVILPGVTIGELTIVGANSVVTKSIPDRCIAVGAPAQVIKKWDKNVQQWVSVKTVSSPT